MLLILIILPATPFPLSIPAFHTAPIPARHSPYPPAFHTTPIPARQTPLTARSQILSKHLRIPCLAAIPYLFAMASMASVKESRLLFIDFFVIFVSGTVIAVTVPDILILLIMEKIASNENFAEILSDSKPVLVDFWATWCGPCRMLAPVLEEVAAARPDVPVVKVDVDENMALAAAFQIESIPTLLVFRDGQPVHKSVGFISRAEIEQLID